MISRLRTIIMRGVYPMRTGMRKSKCGTIRMSSTPRPITCRGIPPARIWRGSSNAARRRALPIIKAPGPLKVGLQPGGKGFIREGSPVVICLSQRRRQQIEHGRRIYLTSSKNVWGLPGVFFPKAGKVAMRGFGNARHSHGPTALRESPGDE